MSTTTANTTPDVSDGQQPSRLATLARRAGATALITVTMVTIPVARAFADPVGPFIPIKPDPSAPGAKGLAQLVAWLGTYAMYAAVGAAILSIIALFIGKAIGEHRMVQGGKTGLLICGLGAFALGIITTFLNAAYNAGVQG